MKLKELIVFKFRLYAWHITKAILNILPNTQKNTNTIAFLKNDGIGDYILIRNFFSLLRENQQFKSKRLILIGNPLWKDLVTLQDEEIFDDFVWFNPNEYKTSITYRIRKILEIRALKLETIIGLVHSREFLHDEMMLLSGAKLKWTTAGDSVNLNKNQKSKNDAQFDYSIPSLNNFNFEFSRNRFLFEHLLNIKINWQTPFITPIFEQATPTNEIGFFIGASEPYRRWDLDKFASLANLLLENNPSFKIVILGSHADTNNATSIISLSKFPDKIIDITGKTRLTELIGVISKFRLLVSNDSAGLHISAALKVPTIVISNGKHFGRFTPYPSEAFVSVIYPNDSFYDINQKLDLMKKYQFASDLNVNAISSQKVFQECLKRI